MEIKFKIKEVAELQQSSLDDGETPPKVDDEFAMLFMLDNAFGVGALIGYLKPIAERAGTKSVSDTLKAGDNMDMLMILHRKFDKKKDQHYTKIKKTAII